MSRVLVTGGAGFIGSHIVDHFIDKGDEVTILDNLSTGKKENINPKARFIQGDVTSIEEVDQVMNGIHYVFHMAALVSVPLSFEKPELNENINVQGTKNVLESAYNNNVKKVVIASSAAVYGDNPNIPLKETEELGPQSPYAEAKAKGEKLAEEYTRKGMPVISLRFFNVYGPRQDPKSPYSGVISIFSDRAKNNEDITIFGDGQQKRDFVHVKDVVLANELALSIEPGEYNVASNTETKIDELAKKIIKLSNSNSKILYKEEREGDIKKSRADITKIEAQGFKIKIDFEEGLKELLKEE